MLTGANRLVGVVILLLLAIGAGVFFLGIGPSEPAGNSSSLANRSSSVDPAFGFENGEAGAALARRTATDADEEDDVIDIAVVRVRVEKLGQVVAGCEVSLGAAQRVTDSDGRAAFTKCEPSSPTARNRRVTLRARSGVAVSRTVEIDCENPPRAEIALELRPAASFHGTVREVETQAPIIGGEVQVGPPAGAVATTDEDGKFAIDGIPPGTYSVVVSARGRLPGRFDAVRIEPGTRRDLFVALEKAATIAGRVIYTSGAPAPGATVTATTSRGVQYAGATTAQDGTFVVEGLFPGPTVLVVDAQDRARHSEKVPAPASGIEIVVGAGGVVEGSVRNSVGEPVADAEVVVRSLFATPSWEARTQSGKDGRFVLRFVPSGLHAVTAGKPGFTRISREVTIEEGVVRELAFVLEPLTASVRGQVFAAEGELPLPGAMVSTAGASCVTNSEGRFELVGLGREVILIRATATGFVERSVLAYPGARAPPLRLPRPLFVVGRVLDSEREPLKLFTVRAGAGPVETIASPDGRFRLQRDPYPDPSPERLVISSVGYRAEVRSIMGNPGDVIDLGDVVLEEGYPIVVQVSGPDGWAIAGAAVHAVEIEYPKRELIVEADGRLRIVRTRPTGVVRRLVGPETFLGLTDAMGEMKFFGPNPRYCLVATHPQFAPSPVSACPMPIMPDAPAKFRLALPPASWVVGRVYRQGGPVAAVTVLEAEEGMSTITALDGSYRLGPLSAGKHQIGLGAQQGPGEAWMHAMELRAGDEARWDIEVP